MQALSTDERGRSHRLQHLRAFAAISVVLYHASYYLNGFRGDPRFLAVFGGYFGAYGVAVFFALSGYLMAELIRRDTPAKFLVSRLARIYPPMLLITALFVAIFALLGRARGVDAIALTLVPVGPRGYFLGVEWTLIYEMTYYVILTLLALAGLARHGTVFALAWLALLIGAWVAGPGRIDVSTPILSELPFGIVNLPFVLGFLIAAAARQGRLPRGLWIVAALFALAATFADVAYLRLLTGLSASFLVAATVHAPAPSRSGAFDRIGVRLGDASYVLYLSHVLIFEVCLILLPQGIPTPLLWAIWVTAAIGLSLPLGSADLALHRWLKRLIAASTPRRLGWVAGVFLIAFAGIAGVFEVQVRQQRAERRNAEQTILTAQPTPQPGIRAEIDSVQRRADGSWTVRGYGIDLDDPHAVAHIALMQGGRVLVLDRMTRMRTATARALGRPDIAKRRFGFSVDLTPDFDCARGPVEARLIMADGRVVIAPQRPDAAICR
jgi:exopolysaccharide production protein ExoZ